MLTYQTISLLFFFAYIINLFLIAFIVIRYRLVEHQGLNLFSSFMVNLIAIPTQAYTILNPSDNWYIKAFTIVVWIDAVVFYHGIYKHGIKK